MSTDSLVTGPNRHATIQTKTDKRSTTHWRPSNAQNTVETVRPCSNLANSLATGFYPDKPSLRIAIKHRYALYIFCSFQPKGLRQTKLNSSYRSRYLKVLGYILRELRFKRKINAVHNIIYPRAAELNADIIIIRKPFRQEKHEDKGKGHSSSHSAATTQSARMTLEFPGKQHTTKHNQAEAATPTTGPNGTRDPEIYLGMLNPFNLTDCNDRAKVLGSFSGLRTNGMDTEQDEDRRTRPPKKRDCILLMPNKYSSYYIINTLCTLKKALLLYIPTKSTKKAIPSKKRYSIKKPAVHLSKQHNRSISKRS